METGEWETTRKPRECSVRLLLPILKPNLHDAHIEARVLRQLFPHVPRWFRARVVRQLEGLELFRRDRRTRPLVGLIAVYAAAVR